MEEVFLKPLDYWHLMDSEWLPYIFDNIIFLTTYQNKLLNRRMTVNKFIQWWFSNTRVVEHHNQMGSFMNQFEGRFYLGHVRNELSI